MPQIPIAYPLARAIVKRLAGRLGTGSELESSARDPRTADHRAQIAYVLREIGHLSYSEIGKLLKRDHTTILQACRRVKKQIDSVPGYAQGIEMLVDAARNVIASSSANLFVTLPQVARDPSAVSREPPLLLLLDTAGKELERIAQEAHRLAMLVNSELGRLRGEDQKSFAHNVADKEVPG